MGTERVGTERVDSERGGPEPACREQFRAAVSVIQSLPRTGEAAAVCGVACGMSRVQMPRAGPCHLSPKVTPLPPPPPTTYPVLGLGRCALLPPCPGSYRPSYEEMLRFYSYYKQATQGPCLAPRPGFWDPIGRYKW